jgi:hypothetical protein
VRGWHSFSRLSSPSGTTSTGASRGRCIHRLDERTYVSTSIGKKRSPRV